MTEVLSSAAVDAVPYNARQVRMNQLKKVSLYLAAWLPLPAALLAALLSSGVPPDLAWRNAVANTLPEVALGILLLRIPHWLPARPGERRARFFAAQAGLLLAFVAASTLLWVALVALDGWIFGGAFEIPMLTRALPWRILIDLLIYGTLVSLAYAWRMAADGRELAARVAQVDALRARAELQALRSQLQPHFILNTIHALLGLVRREPGLVESALEQLGDLLRQSMRIQREGLDRVSLREEWALVQSYLDLERLRLGERLRVSFEAEAGVLEADLPSFALQTLVENAVRHTVAIRAAGGLVKIDARRHGDRLVVRVEDEGAGRPGEAGDGPGGLRLLRERLAALEGGAATLELSFGAERGLALLSLPMAAAAEL